MAIEADLRRATGRIRGRCAADARVRPVTVRGDRVGLTVSCIVKPKRRRHPMRAEGLGTSAGVTFRLARRRRQATATTRQLATSDPQSVVDVRPYRARPADGAMPRPRGRGSAHRRQLPRQPRQQPGQLLVVLGLPPGAHPRQARPALLHEPRRRSRAPSGVTPTTRPRSSPAAGSRSSSPRSSSSRSACWPTSSGMSKLLAELRRCGRMGDVRLGEADEEPRRGRGEVDPGALAEPGHQLAAALAPDEHAHGP